MAAPESNSVPVRLTVYLKKGRERTILQGNPWIFSGSIDRTTGDTDPGIVCKVCDASGTLLGYGYFNAASAITIRMLSRGTDVFTHTTLASRIATAVGLRKTILGSGTDSCRLVNSEGDFLPGLIVDKFAEGLVIQLLTAGMERMRSDVIAALTDVLAPAFIHERSDTEARLREGLAEKEGPVLGTVPHEIRIKERNLIFSIDITGGQKTGFFFDQRENRTLCKSYAAGRRVCDCFSYCGPFTVASLAGDARSVDAIDRSAPALELVKRNVLINGFDSSKVITRTGDIFRFLRETDNDYDLIILDPPKFARHPGEVMRASRGYKDINLIACKKLPPGGLLFTFSCSHAIDIKLFRQIVFAAAADSGRSFQLLHTLTAGPDHPVNLAHKEGEYLKGLVLRAET